MSYPLELYQRRITRAVLGPRAVSLAGDIDVTALCDYCQLLVDADEAIALLRAHGCGARDQSLPDLVRAALAKLKDAS